MITLVTYDGIYMKKSWKYHKKTVCAARYCNNILSHLMGMEWFLEFLYFIIYAERPSVMY